MTFGETIKARRLSLNMYQQQIASRMGITSSAVNNWEKGFSVPTPAHLQEVATMLGLDPIELAPLAEQAKKLSFERAAQRASASGNSGRASQSSYSSGSYNSTSYGSEPQQVGVWGWIKFVIRRLLGR